MFVAKHYSVDMQWKDYLNDLNKNNCAENQKTTTSYY
jgi:hypothetical protein